jgi:hypothetical protein
MLVHTDEKPILAIFYHLLDVTARTDGRGSEWLTYFRVVVAILEKLVVLFLDWVEGNVVARCERGPRHISTIEKH